MEPLISYGWAGFALLLGLGLAIGSFLNVVIYRLPVMLQKQWLAQARLIADQASSGPATATELPDSAQPDHETPFNLVVPRSRCPSCKHQITARENIPLISWLFLRGKCSACGAAISARYPAIELLTGMVTLMVVAQFGFTSLAAAGCLFSWLLIAATFIDYDTRLLPDQLTYPLLWLGLITNIFASSPLTFGSGFVPVGDAVSGAVAGYLFLWGTYWAFKLLTGKEGMGYGDFKLFAALGAWLGWQALPNIILLAAVSGLIYAGLRIVSRRQTSAEPIPFGPFLAVAGWVTLMFRDTVTGLFFLYL